jgi:hypothetical protein
MASAGALPQTLNSITATKIKELSKQRSLFEVRKNEITKAAAEAPDIRTKARILLEGITRLNGYPDDAFDKDDIDKDVNTESDTSADPDDDEWERNSNINIRRFLLQSKNDPSVSEDLLREWVAKLEQKLNFLSVRYEHASFYSNLVTEWLCNLDEAESDKKTSDNSAFEEVGRKEMHEQRAMWESLVFTALDIDPNTVKNYLNTLFTKTKLSQQALKELRERIKNFGTELTANRNSFSVETLKWVSNALLKSDLLSGEKTAILKEFLRNEDVAQEVADVLNMRLASLDSWNWSSEGLPLEMRRQLNGKYRVFMDEDLIDSLLLQYIGVKWSVTFYDAFYAFLHTHAWKSNHKPIPKHQTERRKFFLDELEKPEAVDNFRKTMYENDYFMSQLPQSKYEGVRGYSDEDDDLGCTEGARKNPIETKHSLLHLLVTESVIHTTLRGEFTVIRSDFKWFGPSLSHAAISAVLKFFGMQDDWLNFFKRFLEAPLRFGNDGPDATIQIRRRGIPMSHALSDCFGEAVLFCMDYAVNQHTDGAFLYRLHDDFWFWGEERTCGKAWRAMTEFAQVVGLEFNEEKTGTVRLRKGKVGSSPQSADPSLSSSDDEENNKETGKSNADSSSTHDDTESLPKGDIRWGFLKLDPREGSFLIDQEQVDDHIKELQRQLSACKSVFAWVQAWNSYYAGFFSNNFAKPAVCFGRAHIDMVVSTLSRIETEIFSTTKRTGNGTLPGSVTNYLRDVIAERFNAYKLPEGFFFLPIELGGLELHNPFIPFLAMRENIKQTPKRRLQKAFLEDEEDYNAAKERFEKFGSEYHAVEKLDDSAAFMSLEEYMLYPESHSSALLAAYKDLLRVPDEIPIGETPEFHSLQRELDKNRGVICSNWYGMSPYWKWVVEMYHAGMVQKYGGLSAVDKEFMPLGVVKVLREGKVKWEG